MLGSGELFPSGECTVNGNFKQDELEFEVMSVPCIPETVFVGEYQDGALTYALIAFRSGRLCLSYNNRIKCEMCTVEEIW